MTLGRRQEIHGGPRQSLADAFAGGVVEAIPGLTLVDRDLDLDLESGRAADLVGVDSLGHLVLVLRIEAEDDALAVLALDALAFARRNAAVFPRHFDAERLRPELMAKVVLVAPSFSARARERLAPVFDQGVLLFELRTLRSASGERTYLVRAGGPDLGPPGPGAFLAALAPESRKLAETLLERLARIDDEVALRPAPGELLWTISDEVLARLAADQGQLVGSVPPSLQARALASPPDVELFLGDVVQRFGGLLEDGPLGGLDPEDSEEPAEAGPTSIGILTPEEIEAFRS